MVINRSLQKMKNKLKDKITKFEEITVNLNDDKKNHL